jgi:hypothetical protein
LRNFKYEIYTYPDVEDPTIEQHPVEQKYLRKRQNGRRKQVAIPDGADGNPENAEVLMRIEK